MVNAIMRSHSQKCVEAVNWISSIGEFPINGIRQRLVLTDKGKTGQDPKLYRPICVLNVLAKLLEQLILIRVKSEIEKQKVHNRYKVQRVLRMKQNKSTAGNYGY